MGVVLAVLWLFVRGVTLVPRVLLGDFLFGLVVGLPIAFVFRALFSEQTNVLRSLRVLPYAGLYVGVFLWELLTANVEVAYRVLAPSMPIEPAVITVGLRVESEPAVTTIANSITLTPGTLTMDYDEEKNALYVHAIDGRNPASIIATIRTWEDFALVIFDEDGSPDDTPPEFGGVSRGE